MTKRGARLSAPRWMVRSLVPGAVVAAVIGAADRPAQACGGFFCNQVPIDQSGEQIIFSVSPGHVTAVIQISYTGAAQDFAWVVPVSAKPDITLGSQRVFQTVGTMTQPQFSMDWVGDGGFCGFYRGGVGVAVPGAATSGNGVTVVDSSDVGPYQTVTLESHDSAELVNWLNTNGFAQPVGALALIDHYVQLNMLFVALRLKQDATAGDIQPIVLDMAASEPCVPLILTRIAAQIDMPVLVYVLGSARAFPSNWFHVVPDLAKVDWLQFGANYRQVVTDAINQAAGHGFVTEFAGPSTLLKDAIWKPAQYDVTNLAGITDPAALVQALLSAGYPRDGTMQALLRKWIPIPDAVVARGVTEMAFYNNLSAYEADLAAVGFVLDTAGFIADLQERVLLPLQRAQEMIDGQPYLTRLLSTVSPPEMTRDPVFVMNPDAPDVSNVHTAKAFGMCQSDGSVIDLNIQLEDGRIIVLPGMTRLYNTTVPWTGGADAPAAQRVELVGPSGAPVAVASGDVARLDTALDKLSPAIVRGMAATTTPKTSGCACELSSGGASGSANLSASAGTAMGLLLVSWFRRRQQRRVRCR